MKDPNFKSAWLGRSLPNYILRNSEKHPEIVHARTLTEARKIVFGPKPKNYTCKCGFDKCARKDGGNSSHC